MKSSLFILITSLAFSCYAQVSENPPKIVAGGKAFVKFEALNVHDTVIINSNYWPLLLGPHELFTEELTITADTTLWQTFHINIPSKQKVQVSKNSNVPVFLVPSDTLVMQVNYKDKPDKPAVTFTGAYSNICRYLYEMPEGINYSIAGAQLYNDPFRGKNPEESLILYQSFSDSFAVRQKEYLTTNAGKYSLPKWFVELEITERTLSAAYNQLLLPLYWEKFMQVDVKVPEDYFKNFKETEIPGTVLPPQSLYGYIARKIFYELERDKRAKQIATREKAEDFDQLKGTDVYQAFTVQIFKEAVDTAEKRLGKTHMDSFFVFFFFSNVYRESFAIKEKCLAYLETKMKNEDFLSYLREHHERFSGLLKPGITAPGFYLLSDQKDQYIHLSDFKGKVILLNFWYPGCKPCIAEIPYEQELVTIFGKEEFEIINICLESTTEQWKRAISRYELSGINVVTQGNWERKLKEEYGVGAFPHYVLIDQDGNIIENQTLKPRNPLLADLIKNHLNRKK